MSIWSVTTYGDYSNRSRGLRRLATEDQDPAVITVVDTRRKANWARLIRKVYEVDPLKCTRCGATMRIIACGR